jgi:hypothetical protein
MDPYIGIIHLFFSFFLRYSNVPDSHPVTLYDITRYGTTIIVAVDHTASKMPDPIRTPQQSDARPGQY